VTGFLLLKMLKRKLLE